jgi:phenylacetate-CoA ligase
MGIMGQAESCPCGRGLETMVSIDGRDTDVIITPRGNRLIVHFFTGIFEYYPSIDTFKITQDRPGAILVEIVPRQDFKLAHWELIKNEIKEKGDPTMEIDMEIVQSIPLESSNKRRFVVSKLGGTRRN